MFYFLAFQAATATKTTVFTASCSSGQTLLSCGLDNSQKDKAEWYRSSIPINSTTCECYDFFGVTCVAWCTNVPINNIEIIKTSGSGNFTASCPTGKKVLGCHIDPTATQVEDWREFYPSADGTACNCYDYFGADCVASCASDINNYEVVSVWGTSLVTVGCSKPNNQVLGCGSNPDGANGLEKWRTTRAQSGSCVCFDFFGTRCYAICGQVW